MRAVCACLRDTLEYLGVGCVGRRTGRGDLAERRGQRMRKRRLTGPSPAPRTGGWATAGGEGNVSVFVSGHGATQGLRIG